MKDFVNRMLRRRGLVGHDPESQRHKEIRLEFLQRFQNMLPALLKRSPGQYVLIVEDGISIGPDPDALESQCADGQMFYIRRIEL